MELQRRAFMKAGRIGLACGISNEGNSLHLAAAARTIGHANIVTQYAARLASARVAGL